MPDSNRQVLDTLFRSGRVPVQKSSFLDTPPNPLSQNADFSRIEGMMLDLAIGDALGITTEAWLSERAVPSTEKSVITSRTGTSPNRLDSRRTTPSLLSGR